MSGFQPPRDDTWRVVDVPGSNQVMKSVVVEAQRTFDFLVQNREIIDGEGCPVKCAVAIADGDMNTLGFHQSRWQTGR